MYFNFLTCIVYPPVEQPSLLNAGQFLVGLRILPLPLEDHALTSVHFPKAKYRYDHNKILMGFWLWHLYFHNVQ